MSGAEEDRTRAETNRISAEGGRISAERARETASDKRANRAKKIGTAQLLVYLLILTVGVYGFWQNSEQADEIRHSQECTENFLGEVSTKTNERIGYSAKVSRANKEQNQAWADYVELQLNGAINKKEQATLKEQIKYVQRYFDKLKTYIELAKEQQRNRIEEPMPHREEFRNCLNSE